MPQEFDVVCLGGGVAAEAIAVGLPDSSRTLAVIERELVGGECPYWGCVPSKTLLRSGETVTEADRARVLAASRVEWNVDFPKVSTRVRSMARNLDDSGPAAAIEATGARLFRGEGTLIDPRTVTVGSEHLVARRAVVIANGSTAAIPAIPGLESVDFWTSRQAAIPTELPVSLAILGGGAIGVELGQAFARLGSSVHIIEAGPTFLGHEEPEAGAALRPHLEADGIMLTIGDPCVAVEQRMRGPSHDRSNADVDRAKAFYERLGWTVDVDVVVGKDFRAVQLTPPGSSCSIHLSTTAAPGSAQGMFLVVSDLETARRDLSARGANVSEVFHFDGDRRRVPGPDAERPSYGSYASFTDPDGNAWILQQVKTRLPGRGLSLDVETLTELLQETEKRHGMYEPTAPKHHWSGWYAAYVVARERGRTPDDAAKAASLHIEDALAARA